MPVNDYSDYPLLLTREQACRLLGVKLSQYKILVGDGLLREVCIGQRGRRLPMEEALRFAREGTQAHAAMDTVPAT